MRSGLTASANGFPLKTLGDYRFYSSRKNMEKPGLTFYFMNPLPEKLKISWQSKLLILLFGRSIFVSDV